MSRRFELSAILHVGGFGAALAGAMLAGWFANTWRTARPRGGVAALVSSAPRSARSIEARLTGGFCYAPLARPTRGASQHSFAFAAVISSVEAASQGRVANADIHAGAIAELLDGHPRAALAHLETLARAKADADVWTDLAAANFETAVRYDAPELLAAAFAACDVALAMVPTKPEALFNRALILERLGLRDDAREAWRAYLRSSPGDGWAAEASAHLDSLKPETVFSAMVAQTTDLANPASADALATRDPFRVRATGIVDVLGQWGPLYERGDAAAAATQLTIARRLGAAMRRCGQDRMLDSAVAAIDHADAGRLQLLARGHRDYAAGIAANFADTPTAAEALFRRAATEFEAAQSPMVLPARYFVATVLFEQGRRDLSAALIRELVANASTDFPAYRAHLLWQLGIAAVPRAEWGEALANLQLAADAFARVGEKQNVAAVQRLIAVVYDRTGDRERAWKTRVAALKAIGGNSSLALEKAVASIADSAILRSDWAAAASFLALQITIAGRINDDVQAAVALFARAVVHDRMGNAAAAREDIESGRRVAARIRDQSYVALVHMDGLRASAMLATTPAAEADRLLTEAITFHTTDDQLDLPGLLLQRARARRTEGDIRGCRADLDRGIGELERQRESLPEGEARWGAFEAAPELFDDAIDRAIDDGDVPAAFAYSERARARSLVKTFGASPAATVKQLQRDTVVVEYATLPSRSVVFVASAGAVEAKIIPRGRDDVARSADALTRAARSRDAQALAHAISEVSVALIAPVASRLVSEPTIVFVPDHATSTIPFNALRDETGAYLIERHRVIIAPGAAAFVSASLHAPAPGRPSTALIMNGAGAPDVPSLPYAKSEAAAIARLYPQPTRLEDAGLDRVAALARDAEVVHFTGHAIGDPEGLEPASIILQDGGKALHMNVSAIAALKLRRARVVVLAGCATARGVRRSAEGVVSVAYAFLSAGAPSVVAALWDIDDEAAASFFSRLHEKIARGVPSADALRETQLECIQQGHIPITMWAAVQDIGS
jgi:CHAT domain-containing protein